MTEDDTFLALTRIPFDEMEGIYRLSSVPSYYSKEEKIFFRQYGWTPTSFFTGIANKYDPEDK